MDFGNMSDDFGKISEKTRERVEHTEGVSNRQGPPRRGRGSLSEMFKELWNYLRPEGLTARRKVFRFLQNGPQKKRRPRRGWVR